MPRQRARAAGPRRRASCCLALASEGWKRTFSPAQACQSWRNSRASRESRGKSRPSTSLRPRASSFQTAARLPASIWRMQAKILHSGAQELVASMSVVTDQGMACPSSAGRRSRSFSSSFSTAWASGGTEVQNCSKASASKGMPRAWARSRTYFLMLRSLRPSLRQIQPCWSAKPRQRSLAMWAGILGWPFSQATSRQKKGQHCSEGRARAAEIFFQTAAGQRWA